VRSDPPDGLPDSAFAREIGVGDLKLRFGPELEAQYRHQHSLRMQLRVRIWFTSMATVALGFGFATAISHNPNFRNFHITGVSDWVHISMDLTCIPVLLWLAWSRKYERLYLKVAPYAVPVYVGTAAIVITQVMVAGERQALAWLTLFVMATYFFSGLLFRAALFSNAAAAVAFAVVSIADKAPVLITARAILILATTSAICAIVCRDTEQTTRRSFLEAALLAEFGARDGLTSLLNRRAFDERLLRTWQQALRAGQSLALLMIDIDHFKSYNDNFGHQAGDNAIRAVARTLGGFARRPLDLAARYGGEVRNLGLPIHNRAQQVPITVSIGIALVTPMIDRTPEGAIQLADEALYEAKAAGRDRVVIKGVEDYRRFKTGSFRRVVQLFH